MKELVFIALILTCQRSQGGDAYNSELAPSSTDGPMVKRAAGDPFSRRSAVDKNFIRFGRSGDYFHEKPSEKNMMSYARVSRAAKDNFMRFGRGGDLEELYMSPTAESPLKNDRRGENFMRFGRGRDDNFMRFGRGKQDNFMRFGRTFMRLGRGKQDNFMRFGRKSDNFMRFGRGKQDNFMRFGKRKENFMRFGRNPGDTIYDDLVPEEEKSFVRLGKSPSNKEGFIRFGRSDSGDGEMAKIDDDGPEIEIGDLDLEGDKAKNGPVVRIRRDAQPVTLWEVEASDMKRVSRDAELMEEIPPLTGAEKDTKDPKKRSVDPDGYTETDIEWIEPEESADPFQAYGTDHWGEGKRSSGGGSGFIRFG